MCLQGSALRARGIGESLQRIPNWPALPMVLVWPGVHVSTGAVFAALEKRDNAALPQTPKGESVETVAAWLAEQRNDLQEPASAAAPQIRRAVAKIAATEGCLLARMSGSGSGCFGLFATEDGSRAAAGKLLGEEPDWWVIATVAR
jgi:4-diphosphocytidyl-2-C-methyl-D-erythritol kinase